MHERTHTTLSHKMESMFSIRLRLRTIDGGIVAPKALKIFDFPYKWCSFCRKAHHGTQKEINDPLTVTKTNEVQHNFQCAKFLKS